MQAKYDSIVKNDTCKLLEQLAKRKVIGTKWVWKVKYIANGNLEKLKSRLVAQGYSWVQGLEFQDSFAPIASMTTICTVIVMDCS